MPKPRESTVDITRRMCDWMWMWFICSDRESWCH